MNNIRNNKQIVKYNSNATVVSNNSFKSILADMINITSSSNLRVANSSWDIYKSPVNNTNYNNTIGA